MLFNDVSFIITAHIQGVCLIWAIRLATSTVRRSRSTDPLTRPAQSLTFQLWHSTTTRSGVSAYRSFDIEKLIVRTTIKRSSNGDGSPNADVNDIERSKLHKDT